MSLDIAETSPTAPPVAPETLVTALRDAADAGTAQLIFHLADGETELGIAELVERARRGARRLAELGVVPGDRVGVLGPNRPQWVLWACATWFAGATLVPIQIPMRLRDQTAFSEQLRFVVGAAVCRVVMTAPELMRFAPAEAAVAWSDDSLPVAPLEVSPAAEDIAVLQFTSGSTARPKGALLPHAAVTAQLRALISAMGADRHNCGVSWAPFFHDLGLFGCLLSPIISGFTSHQLPTEVFARAPAKWLQLCHIHRPSLTVGPSSAWSAALRTVLRRGESLDLSSLKRCYFAAEGIDPDVVSDLLDTCARFRLPAGSLAGTYGMAETVLAVTTTPLGEGLRFHQVAIEAMAATGRADRATGEGTRRLVSAGVPLSGMEVRIVGADGVAESGRTGEIHVRGASMMRGYTDGRSETDPFVEDGWLPTGDVGFLLDGELYVTGRQKDLVIVLGHNYHPEDFEWAAERVAGVRPSRAVAFARDGGEDVVVLVEAESSADPTELGPRVRAAVGNAVGVTPAEVVVVERGAVLKTTSGKLQRRAMKEGYANRELRLCAAPPRTPSGDAA